ncbi:MAG TPA: aryl-sulfate sulfotransferase, partial [Chthoniobacterales bacterium]
MLRYRVLANLLVTSLILLFTDEFARATQATETTVSVVRDTAGPTPFIRFVKLSVSNVDALRTIRFSVAPKPGSATRPLSASYPSAYLNARGYLPSAPSEIVVPVFGLYAAFVNDVTFTFDFADGSSKALTAGLVSTSFDDPCGLGRADVMQQRSASVALSYDFILVKNSCGPYGPTVLDTDGEIRWVGTGGGGSTPTSFFDGAIYVASATGPRLRRVELDGSVVNLGDYSANQITAFHHNLLPGKTGMLFEADTLAHYESTVGELDREGRMLKMWDLAKIIESTMLAGGDDPAQFVSASRGDWFHSNSVCYRASDDSLIVSSRENFVVALDYESGAIKWILGDLTKKWAQFPSLRSLALELAPGSMPPIGQHSVSIDQDDNLLLFDNGTPSNTHSPAGESRSYSAARRYAIDQDAREARETWSFENDQSLYSAYCSSVYEDTGRSLLINYSFIVNMGGTPFAQLIGLTSVGEKAFEYRYPGIHCDGAFNAEPIHWENIVFPETPATIASGLLANVSTRGLTKRGDGVMIGGFVIGGNSPKKVLIRGLGPSLTGSGLQNPISDPTLELHDTRELVASNDDYVAGDDLTRNLLVPRSPKESAIVATLAPGSYT